MLLYVVWLTNAGQLECVCVCVCVCVHVVQVSPEMSLDVR